MSQRFTIGQKVRVQIDHTDYDAKFIKLVQGRTGKILAVFAPDSCFHQYAFEIDLSGGVGLTYLLDDDIQSFHSEMELNCFNRLRTLRRVGAPKWIIKHEQVKLVEYRKKLNQPRYDLLEKYVLKILGEGSITIPENESDLSHMVIGAGSPNLPYGNRDTQKFARKVPPK